MVYLYVYLYGNKITHAEISTCEILSEEFLCLYSGEEENVPDLFPKGIRTEKGGFNYALVDGEVVERSAEEIKADEEAANPTPKQNGQVAEGDVTFDEMATAIMEGVNEV